MNALPFIIHKVVSFASRMVLLLPFQSGRLLFLFLTWLTQLDCPVQSLLDAVGAVLSYSWSQVESIYSFIIKEDVSYGISADVLYWVEEVPSAHSSFSVLFCFYHKRLLDIVKCSFCTCGMITWFLSVSLLIWFIILIDFWMLRQLRIPGMHFWCVILFICS